MGATAPVGELADVAAVPGHSFLVSWNCMVNWMVGGATHPYGIRQILVFRPERPPSFDLV